MKHFSAIPLVLLVLLAAPEAFAQAVIPTLQGKSDDIGGALVRRDVDGLTFLGHGNKAGAHRMDVEIAGDRAYVLRGAEGLETWDISNPSAPVYLDLDSPAAWGAKAYGDRLYVFNRQRGFRIYDISGSTPVRLGTYDPSDPNALFENGVLKGNDFYVAAHQSGLYFFDVTNPSAPAFRTQVMLAANSCWDVEEKDSFLFVANGRHGLSVVDLASPPGEVAVLPLPGLANHVELDGNVAFLTLGGGGVATVDISVPTAPILLDTAPSGGNAFGCGLYDHTVAVGSWTMIELFDISNPANIRRVGWDNTETWAEGADIAPDGNDRIVAVADWNRFSTYRVGADPGPDIDVKPDRLDFGPVSAASELTVQVKNTGTAALTVTVSNPPSGISVTPQRFTVAAGKSRKVRVTASGSGSLASSLTYSSNDPDEPSVRQYVYKNNTGFPQVGATAPDFTLQDIDGKWHTLSSYLGKIVYLEFGGLW